MGGQKSISQNFRGGTQKKMCGTLKIFFEKYFTISKVHFGEYYGL